VRTLPFIPWNHEALIQFAPDSICHDDRPGAPPDQFWYAQNQHEVSWYLHGFQSPWLPRQLLDTPDTLADTLFRASRSLHIRLDFSKGLSGAADSALVRDRATAINPAVFDADCAAWW